MALDFGILQPVNIVGNIMAGRQEAQRNQLAQQQMAASQQQLQTGAMQQEKARMEMADFKAKQAGLDKFLEMSAANGKTGSPEELASSFYDFALTQRDPQLIMAAQTMRQAAKERSAYIASRQPPKISPVGPAPGAIGSGTYGMDQPSVPFYSQPNIAGDQISLARSTPVSPRAATPVARVANQLAPPPATAAAPVNQLGVDTTAIENRINELRTLYPNVPQAQKEADRLEKQLDEANKLYTVGGNLVTGTGKPVFTAPKEVTPTEIKKLTAERDALPVGHPDRRLYDQAIANLGSTERLAQERLNFDRSKFAWEKANPGYTIQQQEDGSVVGVNNRTLQYFPVTLGGTSPPPAVPFGNGGAPAPGGAGKRGGAVAPVAEPIIQPRGEPLKGKSAGLTEGQGNAAMFGSAMAQAQQVFDKVEKEGTTTGAVATNLAQGIVKYVPLGVGDKLVNDIYALAVNDPTKLFGPDVNQQKLGQAQLAFSIAFLRKTSGAMFGPSEVANTIMEYFPAIGEDASVVKQKAESRKRAIAGMKMSAGREGAKFIEQYESPSVGTSGTSASDPLGLFPAKKP
jgi:hypothetical protein